jgi:predicted AAA+ superfamily ATPase
MLFIIFIDDLSFTKQNDTYAALKAVLGAGLLRGCERLDLRHL